MRSIFYCENRLDEIERNIVHSGVDRYSLDEIEDMISELEEIYEKTRHNLANSFIVYLNIRRMIRLDSSYADFDEYNKLLNIGMNEKYGFFQVEAYNMMAVDHDTFGNPLAALDCYWNALEILEEYKDTFPCFYFTYKRNVVNGNIAAALIKIKMFEEALVYLEELICYIDFDCDMDGAARYSSYVWLSNMMICYYHVKEYEKAYQTLESMERQLARTTGYKAFADIAVLFDFVLTDIMKGHEEADHLIPKLKQLDLNGPCYNCMPVFLYHILREERYDLFDIYYPICADIASKSKTHSQIIIKGIEQSYYEQIGDEEGINKVKIELGTLHTVRESVRNIAIQKSVSTYMKLLNEQKELKENRDMLQYKSEYDELTKLPNRYKFFSFFDELYKKALEEQLTLSVEIIDVDFFKQINDNYGHAQGDICLKKLADVIQQSITDPNTELGARYGGDEFAIIRLGKTNDEIFACMENLKQTVLDCAIPNECSLVSDVMTVSQGAVNIIPTEDDTLTEMLKSADNCLYEAKKASKNTIRLD